MSSKVIGWLSALGRLARRIEIALLAVWIVMAGAVWSFSATGGEMREGELTGYDRWVLEALRLPGQSGGAKRVRRYRKPYSHT